MKLAKIFTLLFSAILFTSFTACGPVKFSSSSKTPADDDSGQLNNPPPSDGGGDGGGGDTPLDPPPVGKTRDVTTTFTVQPNQNKVDILLVVDNSSSMNADNIKLADRLSNFVSQLESSQIDWQMCVVVTTYITIDNYAYWGLSLNWGSTASSSASHYYNPTQNWILRRQNGANLPAIFRYTLENNVATGSANTNDERGIKAAYWHVTYKDYNNCYRPGAAQAQIFISDEDERSIGGVAADKYYTDELKTLEHEDSPSALVDQMKKQLGNDVRYRANSIIVKEGDANCLSTQDAQGTKAHYGRSYQALSGITGGGVGSICDTDYYNNLSFFNDVINDSLESMPLECNPVGNNVSVTITPTRSVQTNVQGQSLLFTPAVPANSTIDAKYKCSVLNANRVPNSVVEATEPSFWMKIVNWFKSLF